jgi:c-di-AMP phosphodiesterase-like protein
MYKVSVTSNLSKITNQLEMMNINFQSSLAEAVAAAEPEIKNVFNSQDFQNTEITLQPGGDSVTVSITNDEDDYYKYEKTYSESYSGIRARVFDIISQKINEKLKVQK